MGCFCFKTKDKTGTEPNARPVAVLGSPVAPAAASTEKLKRIQVTQLHTGTLAVTGPRIPATVADSSAQSTWEEALSRLTPTDLGEIDLTGPGTDTHLGILHLFVQETTLARDACAARQWRFENHAGEQVLVRDRVNTLVTTLTKYTVVADFVAQPLPSVAGLAWGGFKLLMHAATSDLENTALAMESVEALARVLAHCGVYERLYGGMHLPTAMGMQEALVALYVLVLRYLCYVKKHLSRNTAARGFRNIVAGVKDMWTELLAAETAVDKEAGIAHQQVTAAHLHAHTNGMAEMMELLRAGNKLPEPILRIERRVEDIFQYIQDDERLQVLTWLSEQSTTQHHEFNNSLRSPGTGGWLQDKPAFQKWRAADSSSLLWLHGIAGSGKTTLASKIIDEIEYETRSTGDALAFFYCNYKEIERRDPASILRSLIKQLCLRSPDSNFPAPVLAIYSQRLKAADMTHLLNATECKALLVRLAAGFPQTTIVLDALDECEPTTRELLFDVLDSIVAETSETPVKVFVTSRDDADIRKRYAGRPDVYIQDRDNSADISCYVRAEIGECIRRGRLLDGEVSAQLRDRIVSVLEAGANGMFIWVKHQIKRICSEITATHVEHALTELPKDLNEMYAEILTTIRTRHGSARRSQVAEEVLKCVLFAARPLLPAELLELVAFASVDAISLAVVFDICQTLVVLDERLGVLRFAHFSVQEFLLSRFDGAAGHAGFVERCLRVLVLPGPCVPQTREYASTHWPAHVRQSGEAPATVAQCVQFLATSEPYDEWVEEASAEHHELYSATEDGAITPLVVAAYFQLERVFEELLRSAPDLDAANSDAALRMVALNGNEAIVRMLLARHEDIDVDRKDPYLCRTALCTAARKGHSEVVRQLLALPVVDINSTDSTDHTPLSWAAERGHAGVVEILLAHEAIDVGLADRGGVSPLCYAIVEGHGEVVRLLLTHAARVVDPTGTAPDVNYAESEGLDGVLRMLLESGSEVGGGSETAVACLLLAALRGNEKVVAILIQQPDVDIDCRHPIGNRTPLSWAAECGQDEVVKLLLDSPKCVDVNSLDINNRTPLCWASGTGKDTVVELLLAAKQQVNFNCKDSEHGQTPLHWAVERGHVRVVELLLGVDGLDVECTNNFDWTPLALAARDGQEEMVRMLVARADVEVDRVHARYRGTPLNYAAGFGHLAIVQFLLDTGRVVVDNQDRDSQTGLARAAASGFDDIVRLLLQYGADVNLPDDKDHTPLYWAAQHGNWEVVNTLLGIEGVDVNRPDSQDRRSPLSIAAEYGNLEVVEALLADDRVVVDSPDNANRTPLSYGAESGVSDIVRMLLARAGVDVNRKDSNLGQSPLFWAAEQGHHEVVEVLLEDGRVEIDTANNAGVSPVAIAVENEHEEVVELLRKGGAVMV